MSNIYWMNTIRRKQNKGSGKKYYDFCLPAATTGYFGQNRTLPVKAIGFGGADADCSNSNIIPGEHQFLIGCQKNDFIDNTSSQQNDFGLPIKNDFYYGLIRDAESFKYVIMKFSPQYGDYSSFATAFTSALSTGEQLIAPIDLPTNSGWGCRGNVNYGFDNNYLGSFIVSAYPYILEVRQNDQARKLTTFSEKPPNTVSANNQVGNENTKIDFTGITHTWRLHNTVDMSAYCTKLNNVWSSYTRQLGTEDETTVYFGFLCIYRGARNSDWTPRRHILWFLNRVTNIDTTNDWTHNQLT